MAKSALFFALLLVSFLAVPQSHAATLNATPSDYRAKLGQLKPGDTLVLAAGTYTQDLNIRDLNGTPTQWITITGPQSGAPAVFTARSCCNTVELFNASYIHISHLTLDGKNTNAAFGISAKGSTNNLTHHIRIEHCIIKDYNGSQQIVGISTKTPTWGWEIRYNKITNAGTGLYLGNSNGQEPFFASVIEHNVIMNTIGYNMQIKHQTQRPSRPGMPTTPQRTIIRHNVFIKDDRPSPDGDRPNLLVDGFPTTGNGKDDEYEIYGNLFFHNPRESLFQGSGRISLHDNLFVDVVGTAMTIRSHSLPLRRVYIYNNTIHAAGRGISIGSTTPEGQGIVGNLIFATQGITGQVTNQKDNITFPTNQAAQYLNNPSTQLATLDLFPLPNKVEGTPLDLSMFAKDTDSLLDFNGIDKGTRTFRGAYADSGNNAGWKPSTNFKTLLNNTQPEPNQEPTPEPTIEANQEPLAEPSTEPSDEPVTPEPSQESTTPTEPTQEAEAPQTEPSANDGATEASPNETNPDGTSGTPETSAQDKPSTQGCGCNTSTPPIEMLLGLLLLFLGIYKTKS